jgi:hypothetical protein
MGCVCVHLHSLYGPPTRLLKTIYIVELFLHLNRYPLIIVVLKTKPLQMSWHEVKSNKLGYIAFGKLWRHCVMDSKMMRVWNRVANKIHIKIILAKLLIWVDTSFWLYYLCAASLELLVANLSKATSCNTYQSRVIFGFICWDLNTTCQKLSAW